MLIGHHHLKNTTIISISIIQSWTHYLSNLIPPSPSWVSPSVKGIIQWPSVRNSPLLINDKSLLILPSKCLPSILTGLRKSNSRLPSSIPATAIIPDLSSSLFPLTLHGQMAATESFHWKPCVLLNSRIHSVPTQSMGLFRVWASFSQAMHN